MRKLAIILVVLFVSTAFTDKKVNSTKTYYYYAYVNQGLGADVYDNIWITPIQKVTINEAEYYPINEHGLANQFRSFMNAEHKNSDGYTKVEGEVYEVAVFDESKVKEYYYSTLKRHKSVTKIYDFSYSKDRR